MDKNFSERLNIILQLKGLKKADLAKLTGLSTGTTSKILRNERKPGIEIIEKIVNSLNLTPNQAYFLVSGLEIDDSEESIKELYDKLPKRKKQIFDTVEKAINGDDQALEYLKFLVCTLESKEE